MSADWKLVRQTFEEALDRPPRERTAWVRARCGGNEPVLQEVMRLLSEEPAADFLAPPGRSGLELLAEEGDPTGKRLGGFLVERLLGRGGMGVVYLAEQESPRRKVALKILEGFPSPTARRRFEFESELLAQLRHPGIAQVYEAGSIQVDALRLPYFAMEYVEEGRALLEHVQANGTELVERLKLFLQFCDAVQHGHGKGILHRDLKPANLLVDGEGRAKVIDFGIARAVTGERAETQLTRTGELVGTLAYMAPERLIGKDAGGDVRSDVFSLGVVLHELLGNRRAFELAGLALPEAIRRVSETRPHPLHPAAGIPRELSWIAMRAMAPEPERRYPTVSALVDDLHRFLRAEPVNAGPPGWTYRARKFVQRHRTAVIAASAVALTLALALVRIAQSRSSELRAEEASRRQAVRLLRVRDATLLEELRREADALYPALPERIPELEAWLQRAAVLTDGLTETRTVLAELNRSTAGGARDAPQDPDEVHRWLQESLERYAAELGRFFDPEFGRAADVRERLAFAASVEERTITGTAVAAAWKRTIETIGDPETSPYGGLRLRPQIGFVPLGPDPFSGLQEFAQLRSGATPRRGADGRLVLEPRSGLVFVLIPAGTFRIGAIRPDAEHPLGAPNVDALAWAGERPVVEVALDAFLLSKFELTQAQWERATGSNPSRHALSELHPVEFVDWEECLRTLARLDLTLPTEAQWERAARAGTSTPWWTGSEPEDWSTVAKLSPPSHVAIGSYPPNPFGLHDMLGNVAEWCRDRGGVYDPETFVGGEGERAGGDAGQRIRRGGNFGLDPPFWPVATRSSQRWTPAPTQRSDFAGVRPARTLDL